jgi:hypothetical protein
MHNRLKIAAEHLERIEPEFLLNPMSQTLHSTTVEPMIWHDLLRIRFIPVRPRRWTQLLTEIEGQAFQSISIEI